MPTRLPQLLMGYSNFNWISAKNVPNYPVVVWWVCAQDTWYSPVQLHISLLRQPANQNRGHKQSRSLNMPWIALDPTYSTSRDSSYSIYKGIICKLTPNEFSSWSELLIIRIWWIPHYNSKYKYHGWSNCRHHGVPTGRSRAHILLSPAWFLPC